MNTLAPPAVNGAAKTKSNILSALVDAGIGAGAAAKKVNVSTAELCDAITGATPLYVADLIVLAAMVGSAGSDFLAG